MGLKIAQIRKLKLLLLVVLSLVVLGGAIAIFVVLTGDDDGGAVAQTPDNCLDSTSPAANLNIASNTSLSDFSLKLSRDTFKCSQEVILAPENASIETFFRASQLASTSSSALLIYPDSAQISVQEIEALRAEIVRLAPKQIIFIGASAAQNQFVPEANLAMTQRFNTQNLEKIDEKILERLEMNPFRLSFTETQQILFLSQINNIYHQNNGRGLKNLPTNLDIQNSDEELATNIILENDPDLSQPIWFFPLSDTRSAIVALSTLDITDRHILFWDETEDLRRFYQIGNHLTPNSNTQLIYTQNENTWADTAEWELETLKRSRPLPSGKYILFENERMVAFYGILNSPPTGVLGTYSNADAAVEGLEGYLRAYSTSDISTTPAFEIIVTVADSQPGPNGDYSRVIPPAEILPWVIEAQEKGVYILLDLQPGRSDFLSQAKLYEELLLYENVGLALDPEWRLGPDQFHFGQIGSVSGQEVTEVVDWLAELVRTNYLPQKLLVLHQFRHFMVGNRETIPSPPELAITIHMDGLGTLEEKIETYGIVGRQIVDEPARFFGWKNFFFFDRPTPTAAETLAVDPGLVFISYQ